MSIVQTDAVISLIETRQLSQARDVLADCVKDARYYELLGRIAYLEEEYAKASELFASAIRLGSHNAQVEELLESSRQNAYARIDLFVPDVVHVSKDSLARLHGDVNRDGYPVPPRYRPGFSLVRQINHRIGNVVGVVSSLMLDGVTELWGRLFGYQDRIWTNWYRKPMFFGVLSLAYMRNMLNRRNLHSTFSSDEKAYYREQLGPMPPGAWYFRTANGTFNNPLNPIEGAAGTRFQRNVDSTSSDRMRTEDILHPNPRLISRLLLTRKGPMKEAPFLNMLAAAWIQFQNHDWISHGEPLFRDCIEIPLDADDPARGKYMQTKMFVGKTPPDPTRTDKTPFRYTFVNEVTHWWDGSQVYGSDEATTSGLRSFREGKLRLSDSGLLPTDGKGIEMTGFTRNWWVGLALFHTLFAREHNAICDHLMQHYPDWDDDRLFHTARLINSALMAKIHTLEWNSAINPNKIIFSGNHSNWYGLLTTLLRKQENWRTVAHINVRNTELGGVVGNPIERYGADYGLTQEFVEAYRIHSMLPETLLIRDMHSKELLEEIPFTISRQAGSGKCITRFGVTNLLYSLGNQHPGQVVLHNYPRFMQELSIPGNPLYDMGAVDILRARERGVPRYNAFRRQLGLNPVTRFEDVTSDPEVIGMLKQLYGSHPEAIEDLDFMIGTLAEEHRPTGFAFGETMFQLFLLNATRRLQADRFYTDCYSPEFYTKEGMEWIDTNSLKSVLLRHYPELHNSGLANVRNAFEPWDEGPELDPTRHPTRAFDPATRHDPLKGDAYQNQNTGAV